MCGIVGVLSGDQLEQVKRADFFNQALYTDAVRGWDSTGVFSVGADKKLEIFKKAFTAADFLNMKQYDNIIRKYHGNKFLIGHNRKATKGGVVHQNAHPFSFGDITMVHNGTLFNHKELQGGDKFVVDSEAFVYSMNHAGCVPTLEKVDGAFAVIWHDARNDTINICRNDERPLSYAFCKNSDTVLIASEVFMLLWLADRNNLVLESTHNLAAGEIKTFHSNDLHNPETTTITLVEPWGNWYGPDYNRNKAYNKGTNKTKPAVKIVAGAQNKDNVIVLPPPNKATKRRDKKQQDRAALHDLKIGESIIFDAISFEPYTGQKKTGCIQGLYSIDTEKALLVELHCVYPDEYVEDGSYQCKVQSMRITGDPDTDVLIVGDYEVVNVGEDKKDAGFPETDRTDLFRGPNGVYISRDKFMELTTDGCVWCGDVISPVQAEYVGWGNNNSDPICPGCMDESHGAGNTDGTLLT